MELEQLKRETQEILLDLLSKANLHQGQILVLGLSTSEVAGASIGKNSSLEIGQAIVKTILDTLTPKGIYLAVQGCEHLNRALVVERELAEKKDLEIVNVLPSLHAGGAGQLAAFGYMKWNTSQPRLVWISGILRLGCMSSMCKYPFALS